MKSDVGAFFFALIAVAALALILKVVAGSPACNPAPGVIGSCIAAAHWEVH